MRLLSLDYEPVYGDEDTTLASFKHDTSVFDYDVVIWDPAASFQTYLSAYGEYYQNLPSLSDHTSVQIQADVRRRRAEFIDFVNSGRVLVVIVRPPQRCFVDTGQRTYSGTGRNQRTTRHVQELDLLSALPVPAETTFSPARGNRIEILGDGPISSFLRKYKDRLSYEAVITNPPGTILAKVTGTARQLSSIQRSRGGGYLVLLPPADLTGEMTASEEKDEDDSDGWAEVAPEYQEDLLTAIDTLSGSKVTARPKWMSRFATDKQLNLRKSVVEQQQVIESAREELARIQQEKEAAESRDQLFLGTGRALELEVKAVLELLGGAVTEPEPGRDDWRVAFPEGNAVVEVKGVAKSAAEKHAAQLEKWVANSMEETGVSPKGILVVNTWRETPLDERTEIDFPDQMLPYSKSRSHCLVTGLQLFVIREDIETDPDRAEYWRKKLLGTAGRLTGAKAWRNVVKMQTEPQD